MAGAQGSFVTDHGILVAANRDVELALAIHAPEAVVTGLVEVDEAGGYLDAIVEMVLTAYLVVVIFRVLGRVLSQLADERIGISLDDLISVD